MIANVFVDSQDDIRLILLLMYKTIIIIIIIIIIVRRPIIIGLSNCPAILPQCRTSHTHAQLRIKAKVYFGRPHLHTVIRRALVADSRAPRLSAGNFLRPRKSSWWFCACVELVRPHSSAAEYTLNAARTRLCARRKGTESGKWRSLKASPPHWKCFKNRL